MKGEVLKGRNATHPNTPWAPAGAGSGSKLPEANVPLQALEERLQKRMYFLLGCLWHSAASCEGDGIKQDSRMFAKTRVFLEKKHVLEKMVKLLRLCVLTCLKNIGMFVSKGN